MSAGYTYNNGVAGRSGEQQNNVHEPHTHTSAASDTSPEPTDSMLNTSTDSNDDDAHADAQLLSASILATIQSTPRHHATPPSRTPSSSHKSSTPYLNGRHDNYNDEGGEKEKEKEGGRRNGKIMNNNMYPPSPTANITPRRRSTRVVKSAKPFPQITEREKSKEKEKEKDRKSETNSAKRDNKSVSGSGSKRARKRLAAANEIDLPQPVAVLGRNLDLATLIRTGDSENSDQSDAFMDPNWAESVSLYSLARSWMCSGVDLDPFHILRHDTAESVLLDMHDYIPPPALPPPSTSEPPALPERPCYPSSNDESFQAALKKGCDNTPKALLRTYVSNCKTFRTWWKANYTQRLSKYKGRLAVLFPSSEQQQNNHTSQSHSRTPSHSSSHAPHSPHSHPRTPSPPPRHTNSQPHRTPSPPPKQIQQLNQNPSHAPPPTSQPPSSSPIPSQTPPPSQIPSDSHPPSAAEQMPPPPPLHFSQPSNHEHSHESHHSQESQESQESHQSQLSQESQESQEPQTSQESYNSQQPPDSQQSQELHPQESQEPQPLSM